MANGTAGCLNIRTGSLCGWDSIYQNQLWPRIALRARASNAQTSARIFQPPGRIKYPVYSGGWRKIRATFKLFRPRKWERAPATKAKTKTRPWISRKRAGKKNWQKRESSSRGLRAPRWLIACDSSTGKKMLSPQPPPSCTLSLYN